jgi:hypothetical protein
MPVTAVDAVRGCPIGIPGGHARPPRCAVRYGRQAVDASTWQRSSRARLSSSPPPFERKAEALPAIPPDAVQGELNTRGHEQREGGSNGAPLYGALGRLTCWLAVGLSLTWEARSRSTAD